MRLPTGKFHPRAIAGSGAAVGGRLVWSGTEYKPTPAAEVVGADVGSTTTGTMTMPAGGGSYGLVFDAPYAYSMTDLPAWAVPGSAGNVGVTGLGMFAVHVTCSYTNTTGENATLTAVCAANDDFNIDIILPPTTAATPVTGFAIWPLVGFAGPGGDLAAVCIVAGSGGDVTLQSGGVFVSRLG